MLLNKKCKLASIIPVVALLTACAGTPTHQSKPEQAAHANPSALNTQQDFYSCTDDSKIYARYLPGYDQVELTATVPNVKWVNQPVLLNSAVAASGMRFVNDASPNVTHVWQAKSDYAVLTMNWADGTQYQIMCDKVKVD